MYFISPGTYLANMLKIAKFPFNHRNRRQVRTETNTVHINDMNQQQDIHLLHVDSIRSANKNNQRCGRVALPP
jgi:hypothetical protein